MIYLRIKRLNLILLPSDCPVNHNGRLKFPAVKKEQQQQKDSLIFFDYIPFFADNQQIPFKLFKHKSILRNLRFLKCKFFPCEFLIWKPLRNSYLHGSTCFYHCFFHSHALNCSQVDVRKFPTANNYTKEQRLVFHQPLPCTLLYEY